MAHSLVAEEARIRPIRLLPGLRQRSSQQLCLSEYFHQYSIGIIFCNLSKRLCFDPSIRSMDMYVPARSGGLSWSPDLKASNTTELQHRQKFQSEEQAKIMTNQRQKRPHTKSRWGCYNCRARRVKVRLVHCVGNDVDDDDCSVKKPSRHARTACTETWNVSIHPKSGNGLVQGSRRRREEMLW